MLNTELLNDALETVTLDVFTFLMASVWVTLFPTGTVPYDTEEGVEVSEGVWVLAGVVPEPEPLSATVSNTVPLLLFRVKVPEKLPDVVGLNPTAK